MSLPVLRPLAFGEVLDQSFGLFRQSFVPLLVVSVICSGIPAVLSIGVEGQGGMLQAPGLWFASILISVFGSAIASGASTHIVSERYLGRDLTAGDALSRMWPRIWTILWATISVSLIVGLGLILLIVPGVIAFCGLALAVTAVVVEGVDADTGRSRSWELTKGFKGRILGLFLVFGIVAWIAMAGVALIGGVALAAGGAEVTDKLVPGSAFVLITGALAALISIVVTPLFYCILIVQYYDLRVRKEAFDLDLLASTLEHTALPPAR